TGRIIRTAEGMERPSLRRVVNATGVVVHTNLGRSLLAREALKAVFDFSRSYTNLEFDLAQGRRGSRYSHVVGLLKELTGTEEAVVVNNNAAAVLLALNTLALGQEVIVSRGQLVEIGGSFRIPEVMARSGAILREVGATNKTHLSDYEAAINEDTAALLKVHQSNFAMIGFQEVVDLAEMSELAHSRGLVVMEDLGSGCLVDLSAYGLDKEPTVAESLAQGVDLVTFSGDKMLGGPQAGLILGRAELIEKIKKNPLNRAVRIDKMTLAALEATLRLYRDEPQAIKAIPTLRMLTLRPEALKSRAERLRRRLVAVGGARLKTVIVAGYSQVGGGALPLQRLKTSLVGLSVKGLSSAKLEEAFRNQPVPVIGRIEQDRFLIDPRTLLPEDPQVIAGSLKIILAEDRE
ncbi:MAG: L-seryl-tRNA(Sec) selenium transferase, partial [Deltaproteobacteria bacterium]|nr:L-seryl-tRNA(Sec) selenium transferase [Deltaproteobacteria bacterium]